MQVVHVWASHNLHIIRASKRCGALLLRSSSDSANYWSMKTTEQMWRKSLACSSRTVPSNPRHSREALRRPHSTRFIRHSVAGSRPAAASASFHISGTSTKTLGQDGGKQVHCHDHSCVSPSPDDDIDHPPARGHRRRLGMVFVSGPSLKTSFATNRELPEVSIKRVGTPTCSEALTGSKESILWTAQSAPTCACLAPIPQCRNRQLRTVRLDTQTTCLRAVLVLLNSALQRDMQFEHSWLGPASLHQTPRPPTGRFQTVWPMTFGSGAAEEELGADRGRSVSVGSRCSCCSCCGGGVSAVDGGAGSVEDVVVCL